MEEKTSTSESLKRTAWLKVAGAILAAVVAVALVVPVVSAKTGKFQVVSWSPPTAKRSNGILIVKQTIKQKGVTKTVNRVFYVPKKVANRFAKIGQGYIVKLSFKEQAKAKKGYVLKPGDVSSLKILSSGSGDASGSEAGGAGESEARGAGGGGT